MATNKHSRTILCTWEIGGELGHISRLSAIVKTLELEGHHVVLALKDLSRAYPFFCDTRAKVMQAPVWLPKVTMQRPIACLADTLLVLGYLEPDPLHSLVMAWDALFETIKPDAVIFDYSPTAMLAFLDRPCLKILVGSGFADPVPAQPIADWRPYSTRDDLVTRQEQRVLQQINHVLARQGKQPLGQLSNLFKTHHVLVSNFPELDLYENQRGHEALYCLEPVSKLIQQPAQFGSSGKPKILAYLKPDYPQLDLLVAALAHCEANVFIACPRGQAAMFEKYLSDSFQFSVGLVNLPEAMKSAEMFVGHGNANSTKEALISGHPVLVFPIQLEQLLAGKKIVAHGLGKLVEKIDTEEQLIEEFNEVLMNIGQYQEKVAQLLAKHTAPKQTITEAISAIFRDFDWSSADTRLNPADSSVQGTN